MICDGGTEYTYTLLYTYVILNVANLSHNCERSVLCVSGLFNGTDFLYIYIYISGRPSCRKCSKCFYVYLNIHPMRYSAMQISTGKRNRLNDLAYKSVAANVEQAFTRPMLASY